MSRKYSSSLQLLPDQMNSAFLSDGS